MLTKPIHWKDDCKQWFRLKCFCKVFKWKRDSQSGTSAIGRQSGYWKEKWL